MKKLFCAHLAKSQLRIRFSLLLAIVIIFSSVSCARSNSDVIILDKDIEIYISDKEPVPVQKAFKAFINDYKNVIGCEPKIVHDYKSIKSKNAIVIFSHDNAITSLKEPQVKSRESHSLTCGKLKNSNILIAQGYDTRGTIYAIYTISEKILDVPPLYEWIDWKIEKRSQIEIPTNGELIFKSPYVKWRVWFLNDKDMIRPWMNEKDANYDMVFETMLRLKVNCVEGWHDQDRRKKFSKYETGLYFQKAGEFGLSTTGHHSMPFSGDMTDWKKFWSENYKDKPVPPLSCRDAESLKKYWAYNIQTGLKNNLNPVWNIGFRGISDVPFWKSFPDAPKADKERADIIKQMLDAQIKVLKKETGINAPESRWTLYNENTQYVGEGLMTPPKDKNLMWVFVNDRRDHFPPKSTLEFDVPDDQQYGYYYHFQFTSTGAHYAQAEGIWKMEKNLRMMDSLGKQPLSLVVFNVGNVREFLTEVSAGSKMLWDFEVYNSDMFLANFYAQYFGARHIKDVKAVYEGFLDSFWRHRPAEIEGLGNQYIYQDLRILKSIRKIYSILSKGEKNLNPITHSEPGHFGIDSTGYDNQVEAIISGTTESIKKLETLIDQADKVMAKLDKGKVLFYEHYRLQMEYMLYLNKAFQYTAKVMQASSDEESKQMLQKGFDYLEKARVVYEPANREGFEEWYFFTKDDAEKIYSKFKSERRSRKCPRIIQMRKTCLSLLKDQ